MAAWWRSGGTTIDDISGRRIGEEGNRGRGISGIVTGGPIGTGEGGLGLFVFIFVVL